MADKLDVFSVYWRVLLGAIVGVMFGGFVGFFFVMGMRNLEWAFPVATMVFGLAGGVTAAFGVAVSTRS